VSLATLIPFILVANSALPVNSVKELVALARTRKKELSYASSGTGNATHLSMALLEMMTKIELNHIPYKGTGQGITDVMGGHVPLMFGALPSTLPGVKAGKLKILAISSASRSPVLPDVPTVAEAGVPGYELTSWYGVLAPAGTPAAIVGQLNGEIVKALHTPDVKARPDGRGRRARRRYRPAIPGLYPPRDRQIREDRLGARHQRRQVAENSRIRDGLKCAHGRRTLRAGAIPIFEK
jgi:tripartite-type tricarboxylate transporter receptor subunit TctC